MRFADLAYDTPGSLLHTIEEGLNENASGDDGFQAGYVESKDREGEKTKFKYPRYSRRVQSKSEPSTSTSVHDT